MTFWGTYIAYAQKYNRPGSGIKPYQQTKRNLWNNRNNSSNVSAVLRPKIYSVKAKSLPTSQIYQNCNESSQNEEFIKKITLKSTNVMETAEVLSPHCENCYCRESPTLPRLNLKSKMKKISEVTEKPKLKQPKPCIPSTKLLDQELEFQGNASDSSFDSFRSTYSKETLNKVRDVVDYSPESKFLKMLRNEAHKICNCQAKRKTSLDYTLPRKTYEDFRCKCCATKSYAKKLREFDRELGPELAEYSTGIERKSARVERINTASNCSSPSIIGNHPSQLDSKLSELFAFRKDNYFDCHSAGKSTEPKTNEHKCVHNFTINDRMLPVPLNPDPFGTSRCSVCNKPMQKDEDIEKEQDCKKSYRKYGGGRKEYQKYCCTPSKLNVSTNNEQIVLKVPDNFKHLISGEGGTPKLCGVALPFKLRKPVPTNTYALRFQKGVV